MTETLAYGYSSERAQQELSNKYSHDRVFKILSILLLWTKVALLALEGLIGLLCTMAIQMNWLNPDGCGNSRWNRDPSTLYLQPPISPLFP